MCRSERLRFNGISLGKTLLVAAWMGMATAPALACDKKSDEKKAKASFTTVHLTGGKSNPDRVDARMVERIARLEMKLEKLSRELESLAEALNGRHAFAPPGPDDGRSEHNYSFGFVAPVPAMPPDMPSLPSPPAAVFSPEAAEHHSEAYQDRMREWQEEWEQRRGEWQDRQAEAMERWHEQLAEWQEQQHSSEREMRDRARGLRRQAQQQARERSRQERQRSRPRGGVGIGDVSSDGRVIYGVTGEHADRLYQMLAPSSVKVIVSRAGENIAVRGTHEEHETLHAFLELLNWIDRTDVFERMRQGDSEQETYEMSEEHAHQLYEILAPNEVKMIVYSPDGGEIAVSGTEREQEVLEDALELLHWIE